MNTGQNMQTYRLLYENRKSITLFTFLMLLASVVFTAPFFIPPLYKAEVILSPAGTNSARLFIERDPKFGAEKEIDEQTQILQSAMVRDSMILRFQLAKTYGCDTAKKGGLFDLYESYENSVRVEPTRHGSIRVQVLDKDARQAADMANALVEYGDQVKNAIIKKNINRVFHSIEKEYFEKASLLDAHAAALNNAEKRMLVSGSLIRTKEPTEQMREQMELKSVILALHQSGSSDRIPPYQEYDKMLQEFFELQSNYRHAFTNAHSIVPPSYVISPAETMDRKAWPPRTWIVVLATAASFALACVTVLFTVKISDVFRTLRKGPPG